MIRFDYNVSVGCGYRVTESLHISPFIPLNCGHKSGQWENKGWLHEEHSLQFPSLMVNKEHFIQKVDPAPGSCSMPSCRKLKMHSVDGFLSTRYKGSKI